MTTRKIPSVRRVLIGTALLALASMALLVPSASADVAPVGVFSGPGSADGELDAPKRVDVHDATGNVYIVDSDNDRVQVFAPDGNSAVYLTQFGAPGIGDPFGVGTLNDPFGIAIDQETGDVYVSDAGNRIVKFNSNGASTPVFTHDAGFTSPAVTGPLAFDQAADQLVVADQATDTVKRFTTTGAAAGTTFNGSTSPDGAFTGLLDVAVDSTGDVIVVDSPTGSVEDLRQDGQSRTMRFSATGGYELTYGPVDGGAGLVTSDPDNDDVIVVGSFQDPDGFNERVLSVFQADGTPVETQRFAQSFVGGSSVTGVAATGNGSDRILAATDLQGPYGIVSGQVFAVVPAPVATIAPVSDVHAFGALAHGHLDPSGANTLFYFEYSVEGSGEWSSAGSFGPVNTAGDVEGQLYDLTDDTTYLVRLVADGDGGTHTSSEVSFTTPPAEPPTVTIEPATDVTPQGATLAGAVNPQGFGTTGSFEFRREVDSDWSPVPDSAFDWLEGTDPIPVGLASNSFQPNTAYRVRIVASSGAGQTISPEETFVTGKLPPVAVTLGSTDRTATSATLRGRVNPRNTPTEYWFEYGTTVLYGSRVPAAGSERDAGSENASLVVTEEIIGLQPGTDYHYRVVARNADGDVVFGSDRVLTTRSDAPPAPACANEALRNLQGAEHLGLCRAYEKVSSNDLNLQDVFRVPPGADDGETIAFKSTGSPEGASGNHLGASSLSRRTADGWVSSDIHAPALAGTSGQTTVPAAFNADFSSVVLNSALDLTPEDLDGFRPDVYKVALDTKTVEMLSLGTLVPDDRTNRQIYFAGASRDLSHVVFRILTGGAGFMPDTPGPVALYERVDGVTRTVSLLPPGQSGGAVTIAVQPSGRTGFEAQSSFGSTAAHGGAHAVSDDGERIYFKTGSSDAPLYLRQSGTTSFAISRSRQEGATDEGQTARFIAATPDGGRAFFAASVPLTDEATAGENIYRYNADGDTLTLLTDDSGPSGDQITSAILSNDGSRLYFVSTGALADGAARGEHNAYVWSESGIRFIAAVDPEGTVARASRDGRYAAIQTTASLGSAQVDGHSALYLYDAQRDSLACVSCRPDGSPSEGDASLDSIPFGSPMATDLTRQRNITDDGRLFFTTTDKLVPEDESDVQDVYEYHDEGLSLISSGASEYPSYLADNSDDGQDAFFLTRDALVPGDDDSGQLDLYDARVGGGFQPAAAPPAACEGDGCQNPPTGKPPLAPPASEGFTGPADVEQGAPASFSLRGLTARQLRKLARSGRVGLRVRVNRPGLVTAVARVRFAGKRQVVASGRRRATRAGVVTVGLKLSHAAGERLAAGRKLAVPLVVRFAPAAKPKTLRFVVRQVGTDGR